MRDMATDRAGELLTVMPPDAIECAGCERIRTGRDPECRPRYPNRIRADRPALGRPFCRENDPASRRPTTDHPSYAICLSVLSCSYETSL